MRQEHFPKRYSAWKTQIVWIYPKKKFTYSRHYRETDDGSERSEEEEKKKKTAHR